VSIVDCFNWLLPLDAVAQVPTKRILILTSYDISRPAVNTIIQSVTTTIRNGSNTRVEFFYEFQDYPRIPNSKYEEEMVRFLRTKYEGVEIGVVLALGGPALKFLLGHESVLFPDIPKVYYFHDESEITAHSLWPRVTGVWASLEITKTLDMALTFQPDTQKAFVVTGNSDQDRFLREQAQEAVRAYEKRLEFTFLTDLTIDELKEKVAMLPPHSVVLYLSFFADKKGDNFSGPEALSLFAPTANAPIYGISDTYMGAGIKLVYVTMNHDPEMAGEAFRLGASAYLLKNSAGTELLRAIREVVRGGFYITPLMTKGMEGSFVLNFKRMKSKNPLTIRQKEVLQLLAEGRSMKEAAFTLNVSPRTVAYHKYTMMEHLQIRTSAELIEYAMRSSLVAA